MADNLAALLNDISSQLDEMEIQIERAYNELLRTRKAKKRIRALLQDMERTHVQLALDVIPLAPSVRSRARANRTQIC